MLANWLEGSDDQYFPNKMMIDNETFCSKPILEHPRKRGKICMKVVVFLILKTINIS